MGLIDVNAVRKQAEEELAEERTKEAKAILKDLLRQRDKAQEVVNNLNRQIELTERQIAEGTLKKS